MSLQQQFVKFNAEREKREKKIREEATDVTNEYLPLSVHTMNYLEWDTNTLLLLIQITQTYEKYLKAIFNTLKEGKDQKEKIMELTELLDQKEEDIEMLQEMMKKKEQEVRELNEAKKKLMEIVNRLKTGKEYMTEGSPDGEIQNERDQIMNEIILERPKVLPVKKVCEICGKDISFRKTNAKYCVECYYLSMKKSDKISKEKRRKKYNKKGDEIPVEEDMEDEESKEGLTEGEEDLEDNIPEGKDEANSEDELEEQLNEGS